MENKNLKYQNSLLQARHRSGLKPKQIALLLAKKLTDELYRYENGNYFSSLQTVLRLEIIYHVSVRLMFQNLFNSLRAEIAEKRKAHPQLFPESPWFPNSNQQLDQEEDCFYGGILKN